MKPGTSECDSSTMTKNLGRLSHNILVPEGIHKMPPPLPYGALVQWASISFLPINCYNPTTGFTSSLGS